MHFWLVFDFSVVVFLYDIVHFYFSNCLIVSWTSFHPPSVPDCNKKLRFHKVLNRCVCKDTYCSFIVCLMQSIYQISKSSTRPSQPLPYKGWKKWRKNTFNSTRKFYGKTEIFVLCWTAKCHLSPLLLFSSLWWINKESSFLPSFLFKKWNTVNPRKSNRRLCQFWPGTNCSIINLQQQSFARAARYGFSGNRCRKTETVYMYDLIRDLYITRQREIEIGDFMTLRHRILTQLRIFLRL